MTGSRPGARRVGLVAFGAASLLVLLAGLATAMIPVTYRVDVTQAGSADPIPGWERIGQPERTRVTVTAEGPGEAIIGTPRLDGPDLYNETLLVASDGFSWDEETASFRSQGPGQMVFEGTFGDIHIPVLPGTTSQRVVLERETRTGSLRHEVSALEAGETGIVMDLGSMTSQFARTSSFLWRAAEANWPGPPPDRVAVWVAGQDLDASAAGRVPLESMAAAALAALGSGLAVLAAAVALLAVAWLAGAAIDSRGPPGLGRQVARVLVISCAALAVGNGLAYVLPARWAALIVVIGVGLTAVIGLVRAPRGILAPAARELAVSLPWVLVPAVVLFFPVLVWGSWFAGTFKTDLYEYATLASISTDHSLMSMRDLPIAQASGGLASAAGITWRSIDGVGAAMVGQWLGVGSVAALVVLALALFILFGLAVLALAKRVNRVRLAAPIVSLVLLNPLFVGLFVEGYYSHYVFVALIPGLVLILASLFEPDTEGPSWTPDRFLLWAAAAVCAVLVAVYPYFFIVVLAGLALAALLRHRWRRKAITCIFPVAWRTLLLANLAIVPALNFGETVGGQQRLDEIARWVLLSPFSTAQQVFLMFGFVPYQWRQYLAPAEDYMGGLGQTAWNLAHGAATVGLEMLVGAALVVLLLLVLSVPSRLPRAYASLASAFVVGLWLAFGAVYLLSDRPYPMLKGLWTAAALFPLVIATVSWRPRFQVVMLGVVAALALLWGRTIVADRVDWLLTRDGQQVAYTHALIQPDLARVAEVFAQKPALVALARGPQPIAGTDRDRVALAHIQVLARDANVTCEGCTGAGVPATVSCDSEPEVVVIVGVTGQAEYCELPLLFRTRVIEVFQ